MQIIHLLGWNLCLCDLILCLVILLFPCRTLDYWILVYIILYFLLLIQLLIVLSAAELIQNSIWISLSFKKCIEWVKVLSYYTQYRYEFHIIPFDSLFIACSHLYVKTKLKCCDICMCVCCKYIIQDRRSWTRTYQKIGHSNCILQLFYIR